MLRLGPDARHWRRVVETSRGGGGIGAIKSATARNEKIALVCNLDKCGSNVGSWLEVSKRSA